MQPRFFAAAGAALRLALPAAAQFTGSQSTNSPSATNPQSQSSQHAGASEPRSIPMQQRIKRPGAGWVQDRADYASVLPRPGAKQ